MTVLSNDNKIAISALKTAGVKPAPIAKQLGLKYETVKKHMQRKKLLAGLPPIVVVKRAELFEDFWKTILLPAWMMLWWLVS
jgi:hypothetical protein